ncbi:MAG: hypothetical protein ACOYM3_11275 [Terrimicrobiaceae bacterium]
MLRELKELLSLMLGFMPWLLFLFLSGHSLQSLELSILISLAACVTFGFSELRGGFILQWGSLVFFAGCVLLVNVFHNVWVATHMDLIANISLASIIWLTLITGRPFALQYARRGLPRERWNDPALLAGCRLITLVWAILMSLAVVLSVYRRSPAPQASENVYFAISLTLIFGGVVFTTAFKRYKRLHRAQNPSAGT